MRMILDWVSTQNGKSYARTRFSLRAPLCVFIPSSCGESEKSHDSTNPLWTSLDNVSKIHEDDPGNTIPGSVASLELHRRLENRSPPANGSMRSQEKLHSLHSPGQSSRELPFLAVL